MTKTNPEPNQRFYQNREISKVRKIMTISILVVSLVLIVTGVSVYVYIDRALGPVNSKDTSEVSVEIPYGSGPTTIANVLEKNGIVSNARIYRYYLKFKNMSNLQSGIYDFSPSMTLEEITSILQNGTYHDSVALKILIPEGKDIEGIAQIVSKKTDYGYEEVLALVGSDDFAREMQSEFPNLLKDVIFSEQIKYALEGYLFPVTYSFASKKPPLDVIFREMLKKTEEVVRAYEPSMGDTWNIHTFLTMASIIEKETNNLTDRNTVMSVFMNRMNIGMPLQADSTVLYSLGEHKSRVLYADLEVDSSYNSYKNTGLPPGPIANPGQEAMNAVISSTESDYLYFITTPDGTAYFAKTLEEHAINRKTYLNLSE